MKYVDKYPTFYFFKKLVCENELSLHTYEFGNIYNLKNNKNYDIKVVNNELNLNTIFTLGLDSLYLYNTNISYLLTNIARNGISEYITLFFRDIGEINDLLSKEFIIYKYMKDINYKCIIGKIKFGDYDYSDEIFLYSDFKRLEGNITTKEQLQDEEEEKRKKEENRS